MNRQSIAAIEGKGTLRRLTPEECKRLNPNYAHIPRMGFFPPRAKKPKLVFRLDECFDEDGNYFQEAVE